MIVEHRHEISQGVPVGRSVLCRHWAVIALVVLGFSVSAREVRAEWCLKCAETGASEGSCTDMPSTCTVSLEPGWVRCTPKGTAVIINQENGASPRCRWENVGCDLSGDCPAADGGGRPDKIGDRIVNWDGGWSWFCPAARPLWECRG